MLTPDPRDRRPDSDWDTRISPDRLAALERLEASLRDPNWRPTRNLADPCPACRSAELVPVKGAQPIRVRCEFCAAEWTAGGDPARFMMTTPPFKRIKTLPDDGPAGIAPGGCVPGVGIKK
jgi:hypothetical protein